ncbi:MAG: hypothetical protein JXR45_04170 [Deltaproteobacteria bacterium]|nr:hypothetical protein [Deltaproteobacteria bacterium]
MALQNSAYTFFAAVKGGMIIEQEYPMLFESAVPPSGGRWQWSTVINGGSNFVTGTSFDFDDTLFVDNSGDGIDENENGQFAQILPTISAWSNANSLIEGSLTITLTDSGNTSYSETRTLTLSLRTLTQVSATIFQGQTGNEELLPAFDPLTYTFGITDISVSDDLLLNISDRGSISVDAASSFMWTTSVGTLAITIQDATRPVSKITGIDISTVAINTSPGFTVFEKQTGSEELFPVSNPNNYDFEVIDNTISANLLLDVSGRGSIAVNASSSYTWQNNTGTCTLRVTDATRPWSEIAGIHLSTALVNDFRGFTVFETQTGSDDLLPGSNPNTYTFHIPDNTISDDLVLSIADRGSIVIDNTSTYSWTAGVGTCSMFIGDGTRPVSYFTEIPLLLRETIDIEVASSSRSGTISITGGTSETWTFTMTDDGLAATECSIADGPGSNEATITAVNAVVGESGTATITAQLMDGATALAPACLLAVPISVVDDIAPPPTIEFVDELDMPIPTDAASNIPRFYVRINLVDCAVAPSASAVAAAVAPTLSWTVSGDGATATSELVTVEETGTFAIAVAAGLYTDDAGNESTAASASLSYEIVRPVPEITIPSGSSETSGTFVINVNFKQPMTVDDLPAVGDFVCSNCSILLGSFRPGIGI